MSCGICRRSQEDGFRKIECEGIDTVDECPTGEVAKLAPENQGFYFMLARILPGLFDGWGNINYGAIKIVFDLYEITDGERPIMLDKCLAVVKGIRDVQREK